MTKCNYCGSAIVFGGKIDANGRFCNQKCQAWGGLLAISRQIPEATVNEQLWKTHQGPCPKCQGSGPVDVHVVHRVWSAVFLTSWSSTPQVSCRSCGMKSQAKGAVFSLFLGWWGFPWGALLTPVQVGRNLYGIFRPPESSRPSEKLENILRLTIAANAGRSGAAAAGKSS